MEHFYLYRITNQVNGKIYVGVHKTRNLDDGYMGSGKLIRAAIAKHGLENFQKEILETFENAADMFEREKEVVTEEFLARDDVYNLRRGGTGGFDYINSLTELRIEKNRRARSVTDQKYSNQGFSSVAQHPDVRKKLSEAMKSRHASGWRPPSSGWKGRKHLPESIEKIKEAAQRRTSNSQTGSFWVHNGQISKKIRGSIPEGWTKGRI